MTTNYTANPFGETIVNEYFVGRDEELSRFRANLAGLRIARPNHEFVAGLEGTGKSYYLHKLKQLARAENCLALVLTADLGVPPHRQISTILGKLIDEIDKERSDPSGLSRRDLRVDWDSGAASKLFRHCRNENLIIEDLKQDLNTLARHVADAGREGTLICLDEGQRIEPVALSGIKNAAQELGAFQFVLSLRLTTDTGGAVEAGRRLLTERVALAEQDQGTARFFVTGTGMGAFKDDEEVRHFFRLRLNGNRVQFRDEVSIRIGEITDRVPGRMNKLADDVYNRALKDGVTDVTVTVLNDSFQSAYPEEVRQAVDLVDGSAEDVKKVLSALCSFNNRATAAELVNRAYPSLTDEIRAALAEGESKRLDNVCLKTGVLQNADLKYHVTSSAYRYALKIALKLA